MNPSPIPASSSGSSLTSLVSSFGNSSTPFISVVILNYNGKRWLERCLSSLQEQTFFAQIEVIIADNLSTDGSDKLSEELLTGWSNGKFLQNGFNYGFCEGNNRGAKLATGKYLFFLNNDTWLEPDCLEVLLKEVERVGAEAATPLVLNYDDHSFQSLGAAGFDIFGLVTSRKAHSDTRDVFMPEGCSYLIQRELFEKLGGFDPEFFMFADELDLSWRVWLSGHRAVAVPAAKLHHRGAANVNPQGGGQVVEFRTSDAKRFYANRNALLVLLKNAQNLALLLVPLQILLLVVESVPALLLTRRWSFIQKAYLRAVTDCWRLRQHIGKERSKLSGLRRRSDFWMFRFLKLRLNRWDEIQRVRHLGLPKVTGSA